MTAIGFGMFVVCVLIIWLLSLVDGEAARTGFFGVQALIGSVIGLLLMTAGIVTWLWRVMP
jgi:hypothetical protein